jgi:hypothetical protein
MDQRTDHPSCGMPLIIAWGIQGALDKGLITLEEVVVLLGAHGKQDKPDSKMQGDG